jgi:hypothetical protein
MASSHYRSKTSSNIVLKFGSIFCFGWLLSLVAGAYQPICSVSSGVSLAATITSDLVRIFTGITSDVELMKEYSPELLAQANFSAFISDDAMTRDRDVVVYNDTSRVLDLFYGISAALDELGYYHDGRTVNTDLLAIQAVSGIIPFICGQTSESRRAIFCEYHFAG